MTPLRGYQLAGARAIRYFGGRALLADEMGLGKSIQALFYCHKLPQRRPVLIVCPAALKWNWQREASTHMGMSSEILHGRRPYGSARLMAQAHPILIINYQILKYWAPFLVRLGIEIVIFDESHHVQNRKSQCYKALRDICEGANIRYRVALSGTPLTNRPAELWTTLHLLRPDVFYSFSKFAFDHCVPKMVHGQWTYKGAINLPALHAQLKQTCMIRRLKEDVLKELPKKFRKVIPVELSRVGRAEYEYARESFIDWLHAISPEKAWRAQRAQAVVQVGYLLRLVAKLKRFHIKEWIESFLQESDEKLVVFTCHTKLINWLCKHFPTICVRIDGKVTGKARQDAVDLFQSSPIKRLAFCNPKAAGVGLNLTKASHVLYCDFPWTPGTLKQGEDRIHRFGQLKKCFIWFLVAINTIEDRLMQLLIKKQDILDQVLDGRGDGKDFDLFKQLLRGELKRTA